MVFFHCLSSWIIALILSSSLSQCWTCGSSSSLVQSCAAFSNKSAVMLTCFSISCSCVVSSCFLCSFTAGGVVGLICSQRFSISFWYRSIACAIWSIFSVAGSSFPCMQCLEVSQKFLPLCVPVHFCILSPPEFQIWPAHKLFPALPASLLLVVARLNFCVLETASRGRR
jgi:hypothetical protein